MTDQATAAATVDVRTILPRERHPLIFSTFRNLANGQSLELVNDHDPRPLYHQFQTELAGQFAWDYVQSGPDLWRVRIRKQGQGHSNGKCCGSCGGS